MSNRIDLDYSDTLYLFIHFADIQNEEHIVKAYDSYNGKNILIIYVAPIWKVRSMQKLNPNLKLFADEEVVMAKKMGIISFPYYIQINSQGKIKTEGFLDSVSMSKQDINSRTTVGM